MTRSRALLVGAVALGYVWAGGQDVAHANVGVVACTPDGVEVSLTGWRDATVTLDDLTVSAGGSVLRTGPVTFRGPDAYLTVPAGPIGNVRVEVVGRVGQRTWTDGGDVSCPVPPPPPGDAGTSAPEIPGVAIEPPVTITTPPMRPAVLGPAIRVYTVKARCRSYGTRRPRLGVAVNRVPALGQFRVRRAANGRWYGYADRHRVTVRQYPNGKATRRVEFIRGAWCAPQATVAVMH